MEAAGQTGQWGQEWEAGLGGVGGERRSQEDMGSLGIR